MMPHSLSGGKDKIVLYGVLFNIPFRKGQEGMGGVFVLVRQGGDGEGAGREKGKKEGFPEGRGSGSSGDG